MMMRRLLAVATLVILAVGPPLALLRVGFTDVSAIGVWSLSDVRPALLVMTAAAWLAWAWWSLAVLIEVVIRLSGWRPQVRLVGLGFPRALAAGLLTVAFTAVNLPAQAAPVVAPASAVSVTAEPQSRSLQAAEPTVAEPAVVHRVVAGDDLWSLAEQYYGEGVQWRQIAAANAVLGADPLAELVSGTDLEIPDPVTLITVQRGDTLSKLAQRHLGDAHRWPEIRALNADRIHDPDEIDIGWTLRLPWSPTVQQTTDGSGREGVGLETAEAPASPTSETTAVPPSTETSSPTSGEGAAPTTGEVAASTTGEAAASTPGEATATTPGADGTAETTPSLTPSATVTPAASEVSRVPSTQELAGGLTAISAAAVLGGVALARRLQRQSRPVGRRFVQPGADLSRYATALEHVAAAPLPAVAAPLPAVRAGGDPSAPVIRRDAAALTNLPGGVASARKDVLLTRAMRQIAAHWRGAPGEVRNLASATLDETGVTFDFTEDPSSAPDGFARIGTALVISWATLSGVADGDGPVAFPALVTVGRDRQSGVVMLDALESGVLAIACEAGQGRDEVLSSLLIELGCAPWADELDLHVMTDDPAFVAASGSTRITAHSDVAEALRALEGAASARAAAEDARPWRQRHLDPDLAGIWPPQVWLFERSLSEAEQERVRTAVDGQEDGIAAVLGLEESSSAADWRLDWTPEVTAGGAPHAAVEPPACPAVHVGERTVQPQTISADTREAITDLFALATTSVTEPAPWWREGDPMDIVSLRPGNDGARQEADVRWGTQVPPEPETGAGGDLPRLHLLGPIELTGCAGQAPTRALRQCVEYCAWLHLHPGSSPQQMGRALLVAEGTRRSNMSRLRTWLGAGPEGSLFLPDAYSGRIQLADDVSSDWGDLLVLTAPGVNGLGLEHLLAALRMVRGAPLADAAPGQWGWAEELRADAGALIRDVGVVAARKARAVGDVETARWAASRALVAAPEDELLMVERIKTEQQAGRTDDVRRLVHSVTRTARTLGIDLLPETVDACQEAVEGRLRARS